MHNKGFTLLETLITLSLLPLILISSTLLFSAYFNRYKKLYNEAELSQNQQFVISKILKDAIYSESIVISIKAATFKCKTSLIAYDIKNNKIRRVENNYSTYLTSNDIIKSMSFSMIDKNLIKVFVDSISFEVFLRNA